MFLAKKLFLAAFLWQTCLLPLNLFALGRSVKSLCHCSMKGHAHTSCDCDCSHHHKGEATKKAISQYEACGQGVFDLSLHVLGEKYLLNTFRAEVVKVERLAVIPTQNLLFPFLSIFKPPS